MSAKKKVEFVKTDLIISSYDNNNLNILENWKKVLNFLYKIGVRYVIIHGDDILRTPIKDFVKYATKKKMYVELDINNIKYSDETIELLNQLYKLGMRNVLFYQDDLNFDDDKHFLAEMWKQKSGTHVKVVTKLTYKDLPIINDIVDEILNMGYSWSFVPLHMKRIPQNSNSVGQFPKLFRLIRSARRKKLKNIFPDSYLKSMDYIEGIEDEVLLPDDIEKIVKFIDHLETKLLEYPRLLKLEPETISFLKKNVVGIVSYPWKCITHEKFTSLVILEDESVLVCSDFRGYKPKKISEFKTKKDFSDYLSKIKEVIKTRCKGCFWVDKINEVNVLSGKDYLEKWENFVN